MVLAAVTLPSAYQGGERVIVRASLIIELAGKELIVVAPNQPYLQVSPHAVQCFDPQTGYIWPLTPGQLKRL
jgi:hypothetical protein